MKRITKQRMPNRLRRYRRIMGYDQRDVAFLLGLKSYTRISEWEDGIYAPSLVNLFALSFIYRTLPDSLYLELRHETHQQIIERERQLQARKEESG